MNSLRTPEAYQIRIAILESRKGRENGNIIKKLKRQMRKFEAAR